MIGQTISHYKITAKLGEGGMGVVYKAEDTKLERTVALKFLAPHLLRDNEGRKRFEREAKAAARLDHPNICTVYEIEQVDGRTFISMAFLEGQPLSKRIQEGPLKLTETLSIAIQIAEGLEAAHVKGITHRDIKPDNVMLLEGSRGLIKLMDFGLAQLADSSKLTREGTTLGTVHYMSPEQAAGEATGPATDIWSLGVVLYEMIAGQRPFRGEFDQAIVFSIMNEPPEPLTAVRTGVPKELERIVDKCLAKKPEKRYHHIDELLSDLQAVRRDVEPPSSRMATAIVPARRLSPVLIVGGVAALLVVLGLAWWLGRSTVPVAEGPPDYRLTQITRDVGFSGSPALSPDGRLLAYASNRSGDENLDVWVQQLGGGEPIRLTTDGADDYAPSFSPDGNRIVFSSDRDGGGIYFVPALGGTPRRIADGTGNPTFSPDGSAVSYGRSEVSKEGQQFSAPRVVSIAGGAPRKVETNLARARPELWSPDGRYLLVTGSTEPGELGRRSEYDWWLVPVDGGDAIPLGVRESFRAAGLSIDGSFPYPASWLKEGDWVVFSSATQGGTWNLWRVRISASEKRPLGEPQKLTAGVGEMGGSTSNNGRVAFASVTFNWDIWSLPIDANRAEVRGEPKRVVSGLGQESAPSISADGRKLVYTSDRAGNPDIWLRDLETNEDTQVTVGPGPEFRGVISPDGKKVVFGRNEDGKTNIYLTELGRSSERLLLKDIGNHMDFTPDGKKILFYTTAPLRWKTLDLATGQEQDLGLEHPRYPVHSVRFSPDENWISLKLQGPNPPLFIARMKEGVAEGQDHWIPISDTLGSMSGHSWWSPDGNTLYVLSWRDEFACIWARSLDPITKKPQGPLRAVRHFHEQPRFMGVGASLRYGLTTDRHYLPLVEFKANIWLAEPQTTP